MSLIQQIKKNLNQLVFFVFFFANTPFLKPPLVWTNLFSLAYSKKIIKSGRYRYALAFVITLMIYMVLHYCFSNVEDWKSYLKTSAFLLFMLINIFAAIHFIEENLDKIPQWMRRLNWLAFAAFIVSLVLLFLGEPIKTWHLHDFGFTEKLIYRYQGLLYEPSYYALIMSPMLIYFLMKFLQQMKWVNFLYFFMVAVPITATLSFGFFSVLLASLFLTALILLLKHRYVPRFIWLPIGLFLFSFAILMAGDNIVKHRVVAIANGEDTSVRGRTYEAYYLANQMTEEKNQIIGIGTGQIKTLGERHIRPFYNYPKEQWPVVALPNAMAETLAIFGISGLILRIGLLLFLFFKFHVYQNYFRLALFSFLFLYQFAGSFITSSGEYCLWIMALFANFESFDVKKVR